MQLANTGRGAIDAGGSTSLNPATGDEFSGVAGFTYNFKNPTRNTRAASISTSTGACRTSSHNRCSSASLDMPISKLPTTLVSTLFWVASGRAFSGSVHRSDMLSRWTTCRAFWASRVTTNSMPPTARRAGIGG